MKLGIALRSLLLTTASVCNASRLGSSPANHQLEEVHQQQGELAVRELQADDEFYIVNVGNNKVIDVSGGNCADGTNIHLWTRNGTPAQRFRFGPDGTIFNPGCNKVLDISGGSCETGTNILLWTPNGGDNQKFQINGFGALENSACGKVVDAAFNGSGDGTNIHLWPWNGTGAQIWRIEYISGEGGGGSGAVDTWEGPYDAPLIGAAAHALPNGNVLLWSAYAKYSFGGSNGYTWTTIFNPETKNYVETLVSNTNHDMYVYPDLTVRFQLVFRSRPIR